MDSTEMEAAAAAVQKTPNRVTLEDVDAAIVGTEYIIPHSATHVTIAVTRLQNGFIVIGKSAPADPENYDENLGRRLALEDAKGYIWALLGFQMRERLFTESMRELMPSPDQAQDEVPAESEA